MTRDKFAKLDLWQVMSQFLKKHCDSENTRRTYRSQLRKFYKFLIAKHGEMFPVLAMLDAENVRDFRELERKRVSPATLALSIKALKRLDRCIESQIGRPAKLSSIKVPSVKLKYMSPLSDNADRILFGLSVKEWSRFKDARFAIALLLICRLGMRPSEALAVKLKSVDLVNGAIREFWVKGNQSHTTSLIADECVAIGRYMDKLKAEYEKRNIKIVPELPLLPSFVRRKNSNSLETYSWSYSTLSRHIRALGELIHEPCNARSQRHSVAHRILKETSDIRLVAQRLGHRGLNVTMVYTHRSEDELRELAKRERRLAA